VVNFRTANPGNDTPAIQDSTTGLAGASAANSALVPGAGSTDSRGAVSFGTIGVPAAGLLFRVIFAVPFTIRLQFSGENSGSELAAPIANIFPAYNFDASNRCISVDAMTDAAPAGGQPAGTYQVNWVAQ
jgi:hypothetical protein